MGRGATKQGGGGQVLPLQKGGGGKCFSHAERGHTSFEVVLTQELEVLALLNGAQKVSTSLKGRVRKVVPVFS